VHWEGGVPNGGQVGQILDADGVQQAGRRVRALPRWIRRRGGWVRILYNTIVAYVEQAGPRMAAALSYYSIFVGGPVLLLTLVLGTALLGEEATKAAVTEILRRILPAGAPTVAGIADELVRTSTPAASLALVAGLGSLLGFTRALTSCINVTLKTEGTEPFHRTFLVGPVLLVAVIGLLWSAWAFELLVELIQLGTNAAPSWLDELLLDAVAPLVLATLYFAVILTVVPRVQLTRHEIFVPAVVGAILWEAARHIFGWLIGADNAYLRVFGPLGGVVALLGWVYLSSAILVLTGQFAWAHAMEHRGRGHLAFEAPRQAGLEGWMEPFVGDNAVNEDHL
jgi:membrane protein